MRFAVLDRNNVVLNLIEGDGNDPGFSAGFPTAVQWAAPGGVGSVYDPVAKTFSAPPAPPAPSEVWVSSEQFQIRFTQAERVAIRASTDPVVVDFMGLIHDTPNVNVKDPLTAQGVGYLESIHLIAAGRAAQILQ